jgi:hypothetical protein
MSTEFVEIGGEAETGPLESKLAEKERDPPPDGGSAKCNSAKGLRQPIGLDLVRRPRSVAKS